MKFGTARTLVYIQALFTVLAVAVSCQNSTPSQPVEDPTPITPTVGLTGQVVDGESNPVGGARIALAYVVLIDGVETWSPLGQDPFPGDPQLRLMEIFDHRSRLVWRSEENPGPAINWDGKDMEGRTAPDGPYEVILTFEENGKTSQVVRWLVVALTEGVREQSAHWTTNADGLFHIPFYEIPVWRTYPNESGVISFGKEVAIFAYRGDGSGASGHTAAVLSDPSNPVSVVVKLP